MSELACNKITRLFELIKAQIKSAVEKIIQTPRDTEIVLVVYPEGCRDLIPGLGDLPMSVHNAMIRRVYIAARELGQDVGIVTFNPQSYFSFLAARGLTDNQDNRAKWACYQYDLEKD